jgi:hypothetical protein
VKIVLKDTVCASETSVTDRPAEQTTTATIKKDASETRAKLLNAQNTIIAATNRSAKTTTARMSDVGIEIIVKTNKSAAERATIIPASTSIVLLMNIARISKEELKVFELFQFNP